MVAVFRLLNPETRAEEELLVEEEIAEVPDIDDVTGDEPANRVPDFRLTAQTATGFWKDIGIAYNRMGERGPYIDITIETKPVGRHIRRLHLFPINGA